MSDEFTSYRLNEAGFKAADEVTKTFEECLARLDAIVTGSGEHVAATRAGLGRHQTPGGAALRQAGHRRPSEEPAMTILIGLMGPAGAGKSSVAGYLVERYGAVRYSFATPLKQMVGRALEFTDEQLYGTQAQKEAPDERYGGKSARWFLQRIGTEGCRKTFGEDFWTRMLVGEGGLIWREAPALAVVEDARFVNEALAIKSWDHGYVWRLDSPGRQTEADAAHASEQEWLKAPYDFAIAPLERGLPQLYQLVDDACRHYTIFPKRPELPL